MPSPTETCTGNSFKFGNAIATRNAATIALSGIDLSLVDWTLSRKLAGTESATKALENAKVQKDNLKGSYQEQCYIIPVPFPSVRNVI